MIEAAGDWLGPQTAALLLAVIALATLGTLSLFLVAAAGTYRRRTRPYVLLTTAIGLLVVRSVVGVGTVLGTVPMPIHHLTEHGFDFLIALLVLGAIYAVDAPRTAD
ncbi:DUF7471 family protein [Haloarcula salina]|uniref:Uncharacterized protein n=1 Tax=Haloarcula salina TaxID=1429914 RepID=A0AA41G3W0_9EURY|nr:hypothetical protein [Haloarcula salina]MBV0902984.1 hypothetical protein [Haloarcula salina]